MTTESQPKHHITDCGAAKLLGAILGVKSNQIKRRLNIPTGEHLCLQCGVPIPKRQTYCSTACQYKSTHILIACAECGKLFEKYAKEIIWRTNHKQTNHKGIQHFFCSVTCRSRYIGLHYGFHVHPENTAPRLAKREAQNGN